MQNRAYNTWYRVGHTTSPQKKPKSHADGLHHAVNTSTDMDSDDSKTQPVDDGAVDEHAMKPHVTTLGKREYFGAPPPTKADREHANLMETRTASYIPHHTDTTFSGSFNIIQQSFTHVCEQALCAWTNFDPTPECCHVDVWFMLMMAATVDDGVRQSHYKNRFNNDTGTHYIIIST
jgi:hypothetical protein